MCSLLFFAWRECIDKFFLDNRFSFFFWYGTLFTQSVSSPLCFLSPLLFFIRHQRTKLKQVSAPQLPWHAFPFSLNQNAELHDTTNDLLLTPAKGSSGFHSTLITFDCKIIFQHLFYCVQHPRQMLQFVCSLIALLSESLIFILLNKK